MPDFDLIIRGGTVVTAADSFRADVGIRDGKVAVLADTLTGGQVLDAGGRDLQLRQRGDAHPVAVQEGLRSGRPGDDRQFTGGRFRPAPAW